MAITSVASMRAAWAQASPAADQLFRDGLAELKAGNLSRACALIADSYSIDPQLGALFTLAECEARAGKVASAHSRFLAFLDVAGTLPPADRRRQEERLRAAERRIRELDPRVPRLTIAVAADLPDGAELRSDEVFVPRSAWGTALPVDPGAHVVTLEHPDGRTVRLEVTLAEAEARSVTLELPALAEPPPLTPEPQVAPPPPPPALPPAKPRKVLPPNGDESSGGARRALTYTAFGIGTAGVVIGGVAGAILISRKSTVDEHCPDARCDDEGYEATRDIPTLDTTANVGFAVGALGLGTGLLLLLTEPAPSRPTVGLSPTGAVLRGRF